MRDNIFDKLIPDEAAEKLAESFLRRTADDGVLHALLRPSYSTATPIQWHEYVGTPRYIDDDVDRRNPVAPAIKTYSVQLKPMSGNELYRLKDDTARRDVQQLAYEYLARRGQFLDADPWLDSPDALRYMIHGGILPRTGWGSADDDSIHKGEQRYDGEPYGFIDHTGARIQADPADKHNSETKDDLERTQYRGNLYAYKVLIVNTLGYPRSYYKSAGGVWSPGWRDAECLTAAYASSYTAQQLHKATSDPLPSRCECGFHCWYELPPNWESPRKTARTSVAVVVHLAGDVLYASRGVRAQHVKVRAIVDCGNDEDDADIVEGRKYATRAELAAHFGGVPILRPDDVKLWAAVEGLKSAASRMQDLMREDV